jgi:high affinity sulfate transporter 1
MRPRAATRIRAAIAGRWTAAVSRVRRGSPRALDLAAGLTAASVVVPNAMGNAAVAGLPVVVGLYSAFVPTIVYAALGSSRVMTVSTTSTLAILLGTQLKAAVPDGDPRRLLVASATLSLLVGLLHLVAGALRLGALAHLVSAPVLIGFKTGLGVTIVMSQAPHLLGVRIEPGGFVQNLTALASSVTRISLPTLTIGAVTIFALLAMKRSWPRSPAPLVAVAGTAVATSVFGLAARGVEVVGSVPAGLPSALLPDVALFAQLLPGAAGMALMSFTQSIAVGRGFAAEGDPPIRANRELLSTGVANLAGSFFGAMPAGGTSQTALVRAMGGRSQLTSLAAAGAAGLVMLFFAPGLASVPRAALAAVVVVYSFGLIRPSELLVIRRVRTMEFAWAITACLGVLVLGPSQGIVLAVVVSLLALLARTATPRISVLVRKPGTGIFRPKSPDHPADESFEGLLILRPEDSIYFANAEYLRERIQEFVDLHRPRVVALDLSGVPDIEYSALQAILEAERRGREQGIELWLIGLNQEVLGVVRRSGLASRLGEGRMSWSAQQAVERFVTTARQADETSEHERSETTGDPEPTTRGRSGGRLSGDTARAAPPAPC